MVVCEREMETERNCNILTPPLLRLSAFLSRSPGLLNWGPGTQPFWVLVLSTASYLQLVWSPNWLIGGLRAPSAGCWISLPHLITNWLNFLCTVLYNSSTSTFFLWVSQLHSFNPSTVKVIILIFHERMHLLFTLVHFIFWQPSRLGGQYTTVLIICLQTSFKYCYETLTI